jgi:hypothetical protein
MGAIAIGMPRAQRAELGCAESVEYQRFRPISKVAGNSANRGRA